MRQKLLLAFAIAGLAVASAKTYTITLYQNSSINGTELKAGDYKVEVKDQKAVIKAGKVSVEAPVKVESEDKKFASTTVRYATDGGKNSVQEIRLGGTNTKLVFNE